MKKRIIPIFFTTDENYAPYLATALMSLVDHVNDDDIYEINVIIHNMTRSSCKKLEKICSGRKNVKILFTEMQETLEGISDRKETRLKADTFTPTIYYRIFLPEMFPQYDKAIYLDSDIIVRDDIAKLFNTELDDNLLAACLDMSTFGNPLFTEYFEKAVGIGTDRYFNSGVLVMNFAKFREEEFCEHFLYLLNTYDFDTVAPDQDYLNAMCKDRVVYLDITWNMMPTVEAENVKNPKLVHYNLFFKPWHYDGTRFEEYYWEYANKCVFLKRIMKERKRFQLLNEKGREKSDEQRMQQIAERCVEIMGQDVTFRSVFNKVGAEVR